MAGATQKSEIGLVAAVSIGVGGMIGAGIFSILGVVAHISGSAMPLSFAIGAAVSHAWRRPCWRAAAEVR